MPLIRPHLYAEENRHGTTRYRFRKDRNSPRITLPGQPGEKVFEDAYRRLMAGQDIRPHQLGKPRSRYVDGTFGQLADLYLTHMHEQIAAKTLSPATVKQRSNLIGRILPRLQDGHLASLEARHIKALMKEFQKTPHQANNLLKTIRAMFRFAIDEDLMVSDPSTGVKSNSKVTDGFACWTRDDVRAFYLRHPVGTKANLALTLLIVTACRRSDLVLLGPSNIKNVDGHPYISFVQEKTGYLDRARVQIPLVKPLADAIAATTIGEETFLITDYGKPFSKNGFGNRFKTWCREAGLGDHLAAHGVRKAVGVILAEAGCSQYEIMSIHGHSDPATSKIYTATVERRKLAETGMGRIDLGKIMG
jgi:integrase/recombinase XerD